MVILIVVTLISGVIFYLRKEIGAYFAPDTEIHVMEIEVVSNGNSIYRDKYQSIQRPESLNVVRRNIDSGENPVKREREAKALKGIEYFTPGTKMDGVRQQNKMSYAQIVKKMQKETESKQPLNAPETIRVREGNKQHEKQ